MITNDQLTLLVSLVPYLRSRGGPVRVDEAAAHFDVEAEQIRRAVRLIATSGAPGDAGAYLDLDLFDIDWDALEIDDEIVVTRYVALEDAITLSATESAAILAGLQYLQQLPGATSSEAIERLIRKLAPTGERAAITVDPTPSNPAMTVLQESLERGRRVAFDYRSPRSGDSHRTVDPIRLEALDDEWYLRGWCLDRDAERTFHIDRMRAVRLLDVPADSHADHDLADTLFQPGDDDPVVTLEVAPQAIPLIREYLEDRSNLPKPDGDGLVRVTVRAGSWEHFARLACANAGRIRVIDPPEARAAVADWARRGLDASAG